MVVSESIDLGLESGGRCRRLPESARGHALALQVAGFGRWRRDLVGVRRWRVITKVTRARCELLEDPLGV
jgi:hypothetical protein